MPFDQLQNYFIFIAGSCVEEYSFYNVGFRGTRIPAGSMEHILFQYRGVYINKI